MYKERTIDSLTIESTVLSCNFVNTVYAWRGTNLNEYLKSYDDVILWCRKLNVYDNAYLNSLQQEAAAHPEKAENALRKIIKVRQIMYEFISSVAAQERNWYNALLPKINPFISDALAHVDLIYENDGFKTAFRKSPTDLQSPLWPVLKSLHDLILHADLTRIKECPKCGWVFLDETKNGRRRWCSPVECGTYDKMLRYNKKKKQQSAGASENMQPSS